MFKFSLSYYVVIVLFLNSCFPAVLVTAAPQSFNLDLRSLIKRQFNDESNINIQQAERNQNDIPTPVLVENWPLYTLSVGQIVAVSIDPAGMPVIFHRADRKWESDSFNKSFHYQKINMGPITTPTVYLINPWNGQKEFGWLENIFYLPHGMNIDIHGNYWLTDVALHQVFKFKAYAPKPVLTLGKRFEPGSSLSHLCMPTSVAVATTGEIFVADGYCNERIIKYNAAGQVLRTIPQPPEFLSLQIPHGLTLLEHLDLLCIADRENMRVVCPKAGLKSSQGEGQPAATIQEPDLGRVFSVAAYGDLVFAVNGPTAPNIPIRGFTIDPRSETIVGHWGDFKNPHDIAINVNSSVMYVVEIGPYRLHKFVLV